MMNCLSAANLKKIETELVQQRWLTEQGIPLYATMVCLHVMTLAGILEMLVTLNTQEMVDVEPPISKAKDKPRCRDGKRTRSFNLLAQKLGRNCCI